MFGHFLRKNRSLSKKIKKHKPTRFIFKHKHSRFYNLTYKLYSKKKDTKDTKVLKDTKDTKDTKVLKDTKDTKVLKDTKDTKVLKDTKDAKVLKDTKDTKVLENTNVEDSSKYRDHTKEHYDSVKDIYQQGLKNMSDYYQYCQDPFIFKALGNIKNVALLDLACGDGMYTRKFRRAGANPVFGSDLSPAMIELAKAEEKREPLGIQYYVDDLYNLKEKKQYPLVTAVHLIHYMRHAEDVERCLRSIASLVKDGGKFVTVMVSPKFDLSKHDPVDSKKKFGYYFVKADPGNGGEFNFRPGGFDHIHVTGYRWNMDFIDKICKQVGFSRVEWQEPFVSEEGIKKYGAKYFENHIKNPQAICFIAYK